MNRTLVTLVVTLGLAGCAASPPAESDDSPVAPANGPRTSAGTDTPAGTSDKLSPTPAPGGTSKTGDKPAAPAQCTTLANGAKPVKATATLDALPKASGGELEDGVYHLTAKRYYGLATAPVEEQSETIEVKGSVIHEVELEDGVSSQKSNSFAIDEETIEISKTCPAAEAPEARPFTVDGAKFVLFDAKKKTAKEYTKQ
jgi:hypothetical protein